MSDKIKYRTFRKNRSLRLKNYDYSRPYAIYYLTICSFKKIPHFICDSFNGMIVNNIKNYTKIFGYSLIVFCVMPDHIHLLIQAEESAGDLRDLVRDFKKFTTHQSRELGVRGNIWQRGYYEHIIRKHEDISKIAEYILNNPVKKGLVDKCGNYEYCGLINPPI